MTTTNPQEMKSLIDYMMQRFAERTNPTGNVNVPLSVEAFKKAREEFLQVSGTSNLPQAADKLIEMGVLPPQGKAAFIGL